MSFCVKSYSSRLTRLGALSAFLIFELLQPDLKRILPGALRCRAMFKTFGRCERPPVFHIACSRRKRRKVIVFCILWLLLLGCSVVFFQFFVCFFVLSFQFFVFVFRLWFSCFFVFIMFACRFVAAYLVWSVRFVRAFVRWFVCLFFSLLVRGSFLFTVFCNWLVGWLIGWLL